MSVLIDFEDAQAISQIIEEHLKYDSDCDRKLWEPILIRLNLAIEHSSDN